ncbi:MAG TPA: polysaccharide deacetylase family protein [Solirubrobacteraceae bacterium]|nr:polysaccharide deacetylase family protein [Solirubrobacteraceae bacterium]
MKRWDWTWDDPTKSASVEPEPPRPAPPRLHQIRRRRAIGALALLAIVVLVLVLVLAAGGRGGARHARPRAHAPAPVRLSAAEQTALIHREEDHAIDSVLAYAPAVVQGGPKGNEVALTFDDGPGPYTTQLVDKLNQLHVRATFFAIGFEEQYFSAGTLAELRSGDVVGNHTQSHPLLAHLSKHAQREQLLDQTYRIQLLGGPTPRLFRPPYGSFNADTLHQLRSLHMLMVLWSTDTGDYERPGAAAIAERALAGVHPGSIILLHDAGGNRTQTIAALPAIIHGLRIRGLHPVTVPRLLLDDPPPPGQRIPTTLAEG